MYDNEIKRHWPLLTPSSASRLSSHLLRPSLSPSIRLLTSLEVILLSWKPRWCERLRGRRLPCEQAQVCSTRRAHDWPEQSIQTKPPAFDHAAAERRRVLISRNGWCNCHLSTRTESSWCSTHVQDNRSLGTVRSGLLTRPQALRRHTPRSFGHESGTFSPAAA